MKKLSAITCLVVSLGAFLIPCALLAQSQPLQPFTGPVSKYYFSNGNEIVVVQGNKVVSTFPLAYGKGDFEGALAVSETIRTRLSDANAWPPQMRAGEYTLDGVPTGHSYQTPITGGWRYYDGTTDGSRNYFVDHGLDPLLGGVYGSDYFWQKPKWLFYPLAICNLGEGDEGCHGLSGIAYDPTNNSLWISGRGYSLIGNYSLAGDLLAAFDTAGDLPPGYNAGLGVDPADHTLWVTTNGSGALRQYSLDGATFGQLLQAGIPDGLPPGGYESGEFQVLGCTSSTITNPPAGGCLTPGSLTFARQVLGTTSNIKSVKLVNTGNEPLAIAGILTSGDFSQANNCPISPKRLDRAAFCTLKVRFTPTAIDKRAGGIVITYNPPARAQQVFLSGLGTMVTLSPPILNFGEIIKGQQSNPMTATLINRSNTTLVNISNTTITGGSKEDYSILSNTCTGAISPLGTCTVTVVFKPSAWWKRGATLNIFHDGGGSPSMVSMMGTGR